MVWTTLVNSTTADATVVNDDLYWVRQGNLIPMAGASMGYTDAAHDLGGTPSGTSSTIRWRDAHLSRDIYNGRYMLAGPQTSGGINMWAGFIQWKEYPYMNTTVSVHIPPCKVEIQGQIYYNNATQTCVFSTTTDWVTSQAGATISTHIWIYAVPTTTGGWVAKLDDEQPTWTMNSVTTGLYHNGVGASGSTNYRAIHVMYAGSTSPATVTRFFRRGNYHFFDLDINILGSFTVTQVTAATLTTSTFAAVPDYPTVHEMQAVFAKNTSTISFVYYSQYAGDTNANTAGTFLAMSANINQTFDATAMSFWVPMNGNEIRLRLDSAAGASAVRVYPIGFRMDYGPGNWQ